ncbi:MAG: hypothetical protein K2N18_06460, partial [Clostridia bacterium]|nr:hypothetical protein [Clostridia bacterium]
MLNLTEEGADKDNFASVITGKQNENIYFGSKSGEAIKWRVLSTTDTKYDSGNSWLLWADSSLGSEKYNDYYNNPYYAYWGTSKIRATLNGGKYLSTVSSTTTKPAFNQTVATSASYLYTYFSSFERANMVASGSYQTKNFGYDNSHTTAPKFHTTGIADTTGGNGKYKTADVNSMNTLAGTAATISVNGTSVLESTSGDYLFLLDYYDVNNTAFGMCDNGVTYAEMLNSSWTSNQAGYPSYNDDSSVKAEYLKSSGYYWLRPAGRNGATGSIALLGYSNYIGFNLLNGDSGVRPAFNFSPQNIIYATAADVSSNGDTFASVSSVAGDKPTYKLCIKSSVYR